MRRAPALVEPWRPLPFSFFRLRIGLRRLTSTRAQLATGLLALGLLAFIGVDPGARSSSDEADNVMGACLISRGAALYRDFFSHHFPLAVLRAGRRSASPLPARFWPARVLGIVRLTVASCPLRLDRRNALAPVGAGPAGADGTALLPPALSG